MNALAFHGSPRKNGSSDTLLKYFLKGLGEGADNKIVEIHANDLNVRPCQMCLSCNEPPEYRCVIQDDMQGIYSTFIDADIVVFATPMLWGYMTAQLKTVLDRMEAIASKRYFGGKDFVVIVTYHHHCESTIAFFKRITDYYGSNLHTIIYCSLGKDGQKDIHVSHCREKLEEAYQLGQKLKEG